MEEDTIRSLFRESVLAGQADELMNLAERAISIETLPPGDGLEHKPRVSRIGGLPDLPAHMEWPQWDESPIPLIAQINLADIAAYDIQDELPHTGMLYFFFNEDAFDDYPPKLGSWQVIYYAGSDKDFRPASLRSDDQRTYLPHAIKFASRVTLPPFDSVYMQRLGFSYTDLREEAPAEQKKSADAYCEFLDTMNNNISTHHQLLGYPYQIQGDLLWECQRDTKWQGESTDWRLLFQIDSDDSVDMMWGDVGVLYFYILKDALQARDFSQVQLLMQCC